MKDSNLPPGCSQHDIDRAAGCYATCESCGREVGAEALNEDGLCPRCANDNSDSEP